MSGVFLDPSDRAYLLAMMRRQTRSTVHRRMNALLLLDDGWTSERVAEVLFIDAETVRQYRRLYEADGTTGLTRLGYEGSEPALNPEQLTALAGWIGDVFYRANLRNVRLLHEHLDRHARPAHQYP